MSRPRKPFGPKPPGRLPATMVKVLAAELSDSGRLTRGKRYWADDAVVDIVIGHGSVTGEVQGSRRAPYVVTIEATPGDGVPGRRDVWLRCSCPDDTGTGEQACKHAVAVLFALSDEIAIEPAVLERWRSGRGSHGHRSDAALPSNVIAFPTGRTANDRDDRADDDTTDDAITQAEEIARLLGAPAGRPPDELPTPVPWSRPDVRDPLIDPLLDDALDQLEIRWE